MLSLVFFMFSTGTIVCKAEALESQEIQGYIAMLAVDSRYRGQGIGTALVKKAIHNMIHKGKCTEILLETEVDPQIFEEDHSLKSVH